MTAPVRTPWPELSGTGREVLLELLLQGEQPRVRLAERVGLSRASLTRIARELVDRGLVAEGGTLALPGRGRPAEVLQLQPRAAHFVGVKLTGDGLYGVLCDLSGRIEREYERKLPRRDVDAVVALIGEAAEELFDGVELPSAIGVGLAGDMNTREGRSIVEGSHFLGWDGVPLAHLITAATGYPAYTVNDVHALAAAHHWFDNVRGAHSMVVFGIGAGIGSGVVIDGELREGARGRSGRVGHSRVGGTGRRCDNGHIDCVHSFVTMPAIEVVAGVAEGEYTSVVERAERGDAAALAAFERASFALGVVVADAVNAHDPDVVSLMGEGLAMLDFAPEPFAVALAEYLEQIDPADVVVERPDFGFSLYARAAAVFAERQLLANPAAAV